MPKHLVTSFVLLLCCLSLNLPTKASDPLPNHAVILLYHHVANNTPAITSISPEIFDQQLQYLADKQFQVWPLEKIIDHLQKSKAMPDKVVAITFDDSYQSVYETAYPTLKKHQWPFTIFVSTDSIDGQYNNQTSWQQLRIMANHGATIANHSASHRHLLHRNEKQESLKQWQQRIEKDIVKAQQRIEQEIGQSHKLFAYPYGEYNAELAKIVSNMGYTAFGQQSGAIGEHSDFLAIPRFPFSGSYTALEDFALKVMTLPLPVKKTKAVENPLPYNNDKPKLTLELHSDTLFKQSLSSLQCFASYQGKINSELTSSNNLMISPDKNIPVGRSRYNCTSSITHQQQQRFYWFSHPWIRLDKDNQWVLD